MRTKITLLVLALIALLTVDALARPGGGSSFSGRSGSSSSSSGSYRSGSSSSSSSGSSFRSTSSSSSSGSSYRSTSSSSSSSSGGSRWSGSSTSSSSSGSTYTSSSSSTSSSGSYSGSYSGSSSGSYSGGGGSASDDGSFGRGFLIFLGIAIVAIALVIYLTRAKRQAEWEAWQSHENAEREWRENQRNRAEEEARTKRYDSIDKAIAAIRAYDDAFSYILFEDFLYALYAEVHTARGEQGGLARLSPYLGTSAVATYGNLPKRKLEAVVIGGMRVDSVEIDDDKVTVSAVFTSNVSEHGNGNGTGKKDVQGDKVRAWFMEERWKITRALGVKSRPPSRARTIGCPSCGAPLDKIVAGKCGYCNTTSAGGANDWFVEQIEVLAREERGPMLTGTTEEVGTDLPTVVAKNANKRLEKLRESDPAFTWPAFIARVEKTFEKFHASWCAQDLTAVRPYLSDNLVELQRYWVKAYKDQKLRNLTKDAKVITVHLARVMRDKFYDSITVRVFATCIDYTVDAEDKVVGGRPSEVREYSEYWTFIRGVGKQGAPRTDDACPNCGAAFNSSADDPGGVNMSGTCTHCNVKITSGEFDWVLSRIEQDEVYEVAA